MGSVGFSEMVLIGIVALIVYGEKLPYVARDVGRYVEKMRRQFMDIKWEINRAIDIEEAAARPPEPPPAPSPVEGPPALPESTPAEAPAEPPPAETQDQSPPAPSPAEGPAPDAPPPAAPEPLPPMAP